MEDNGVAWNDYPRKTPNKGSNSNRQCVLV